MDRSRYEVPSPNARRSFEPEDFRDLPEPTGIVGQQRAERAIDFGLAMGAHMFLVGPAGTGKRTYMTQRLAAWAAGRPTPDDWCYVPRFDRRDEPAALALSAGQSRQFHADVDGFVKSAHRAIREAFEAESYSHHRQALLQDFDANQQAAWRQLEQRGRELGFAVQAMPTGQVVTVPLAPDGQPFREQDFQALPEELRRHLQERQAQLAEPAEVTVHRMRAIAREAKTALQTMDHEVALSAARPLADTFASPYADMPAGSYFGDVLHDLIQHLDELRRDDGDDPSPWMSRYAVREVAVHPAGSGAPVILESHPTYANLFGQVHLKQVEGTGGGLPDIAGGSVLRANGGYLILMADDLLQEPYSYGALKRVLRQGWIRVEAAPEPVGWMQPPKLYPEPIPLQVTIVLVGPPHTYYALYNGDPDFRRLFKIKAEFAADMPATQTNLSQFAGLLRQAAQSAGHKVPDAGALARLLEFAAELAEHQDRLSAQVGDVLAVLDEAQVWAAGDGAPAVRRAHVDRALLARRERSDGPAQVMQRLITDETLLIRTEGALVGQVNGLAVMSAGDTPFGHPSRITAVVWAGEPRIVNIEREIRQSGVAHSKGVLTLTGFFSGRFGTRQALTLSASIGFEQVYDGVDGDSASSAELYALMSAISGIPIDQGVAVTGSVDQHGAIEPIGGVNQKIEGFFQACRSQGLSGKQGVMIPRRNLKNLMVSREVQEAIQRGQFHLWAVDTVDQGIEVLTGVPAAAPDDGPDTVMGRIAQRLRQFSEVVRPTRDA